MTRAIIVAAVVVVVAVRLWLRRRNRSSATSSAGTALGPFTSDVALVAAREVRERVRGRIFRVGTVLILAVVAAAIVIPTLRKGKSEPAQIGVVGTLSPAQHDTVTASAASIGTAVQVVAEPNIDAARADLRSGHIDLALVDGQELVVNKAIGPTDTSDLAQFARALADNLGVARAFAAAGLTAGQEAELAHPAPLPVASLQAASSTKSANHGTSLVGLILIFVMLTQYNTWVLIGVMEEKASRVVEVLLAAIRPIELLTGKVLGIGLVAIAQAALIVVFALGVADAVGSDLLHGSAPLVLASTLVWLVLGYAFYSWVYAAAGSMAERQDQVQSLAFPLSLPIIFGYITSLTAIGSTNPATWFKVLAYLPPTAPFAMPVLVGLGAATWWEFAASAALSVVCTVGVARVAAVIYRRAILRTGRRVRLPEVLARSGHKTANAR